MKIIAISILSIILISCSITKRRVLPGYHIIWGTYELSSTNGELKNVKYESNVSDFKNNKDITEISIATTESACDTIFLLDGSSIIGKIIRQDSKIIEHKSCEVESSFINKIYKSKIKSITYSNGYVYKVETKEEVLEKRKEKEEKHSEIVKEEKKNITPLIEKDKVVEKNGHNSLLMFLFGLLLLLTSPLVIIFSLDFLFIAFLALATIAILISFILAIKSMFVMSKNPDLYKSKGLIIFISIIEFIYLTLFTLLSISIIQYLY